MKVKMTLSIGLRNARQEEIVELPDDTTEEDIEMEWQQWISNFIDGGWERLDKKENGDA